MEKFKLNLVFHNVLKSENELKSPYDFTYEFIFDLVKKVEKLLINTDIEINVFFDDGYESQFKAANYLNKKAHISASIGIITGVINKISYLSDVEIIKLKRVGVKICSHGVSHTSLAKLERGKFVGPKKEGCYRNMPVGKKNILTRNEILFQLKESCNKLKSIGVEPYGFIYPYGLYNNKTKEIIERSGVYERAFSCDEGLESTKSDRFALPRIVINRKLNVDYWISKIKTLADKAL